VKLPRLRGLAIQLPHFTAAMDGLLRTSHPPPSARKVRTAARAASCTLDIVSCHEKLTVCVQNIGQRNCAGLVGPL